MQRSKTNLTNLLESNRDDRKTNQDEHSTSDINQLTCCLKNAIFSKYISDYLIEKAEKMWDLYEKRIDQYLQETHLDITCPHRHPQTTLQLKELARQQQEDITTCKRDIEIFCSSRKQALTDEKYAIQLQSMHQSATSGNSIRVPKTPRCVDRYGNDWNEAEDYFLAN